MTVDEVNLRLRLANGDGLCLNEHTIHQAESLHGCKRLWLDCGSDTFASRDFTWEELGEGSPTPVG